MQSIDKKIFEELEDLPSGVDAFVSEHFVDTFIPQGECLFKEADFVSNIHIHIDGQLESHSRDNRYPEVRS